MRDPSRIPDVDYQNGRPYPQKGIAIKRPRINPGAGSHQTSLKGGLLENPALVGVWVGLVHHFREIPTQSLAHSRSSLDYSRSSSVHLGPIRSGRAAPHQSFSVPFGPVAQRPIGPFRSVRNSDAARHNIQTRIP